MPTNGCWSPNGSARPRRPADRYRLVLADGHAEYQFDAQLMAMRHWRIPPESISKTMAGTPAPLDALQFVIEIRDKLGMPEDRLPIYLDEITSTLRQRLQTPAPRPRPPNWRWLITRPSRPR